MDYSKYSKGSEWRKWDLHIHSPSAALNNQFTGTNISDKWDSYFEKLNSLTDIAVLGITDYFSVDGYRKVKEFKESGELDNIHFILPNIELRLIPVTDTNTPINLHLIINPTIVDDIDSLLFNNLEHQYNGTTYKCTEDNLTSLGRAYNESLTDGRVAYNEGVNQFKITLRQLNEVFDKNKELKNNTIVVVANSNNDGNSGIQHSSLATTRQEIYRFSDLIFSSNPEDRKYFLGKKVCDTEADIIKKYGNLMPCIHGSDAHCIEDVCNPNLDRFTWIKANPTFEGLKQIIYEPEYRVRIQQEKPEQKIPYTVIDAVRFIDTRVKKEFSDNWIELNPNLNSIIGGKSSGKSLLLYHTAKTIDPERINNINAEKKIHQKIEYSFEGDSGFDFEVRWADGETYRLKDSDKPNRPITYIPQLYLNRLAEDQKNELNNLVDKMLIESSSSYEEFRNKNKQKLGDIKTEMFQVIDEYYKIKNLLKDKEKELKEFGDKNAIIENQKIITAKIDVLRRESSFSEKDEAKYLTLTSQIKELKEQRAEISTAVDVLKATRKYYGLFKDNMHNNFGETIFSTINPKFPVLSTELVKKISSIISNTEIKLREILDSEIKNSFTGIDDEEKILTSVNEQIKIKSKELDPLAEKVKNKSVFSQLQKDYESESIKLKALNEKIKEIDKLNKSLSIEKIKNKYGDLFKCYKVIVDENKKYESIPDTDDLKLNSIIKMHKEKFDENFVRKINKKKSLSQQFTDIFNDENDYVFEQEQHLDNVNTMIASITSGKISLNTGFDEQHVMLSLLDDYFYIDYNLLQDGDDLIKMSPGKRGIILFQLFLHLSKSENPILIDQPEDNLDNRTVYQELNDFIKTKKSTRQIIIVSHNPNLVVSTDSENIIIANQDGQNKSGANSEFKFEYVNGAIELSFIDKDKNGILFQRGIRQHVCDILEGGKEAFEKRESKYGFK